ncbi:integrin alpha-X-like [Etheostoma cragini]|uniref:integrin alpha-X-like n=1 Tax=Etheostoma cragini TaxID=417921 RepID=UPI00155E6429|nr:integrin alpha-X-like [Etheostoma cragini]
MGKMHGQSHIFLLTFMVAVAIPISLAFNIDITNPDVYTGEQKDFFGYKVLQFMNGENKGIIVTAPLQLNGSGGICKPDQNQTTKCFNPEDTKIPVKHLGLSIAEDSNRSQFTVCSPSVVRECYGNSYMNSSFRSRPIFNVTTRLSFDPNEISTEKIDCLDHTDANLPMVTLQACFEIVETTKSKAVAMDLGLNISYTLEVDANRQTNRGFFSQTPKKARNLTSTYKLRDPDTCFNYTIYMPKCVKDTLLPISIKLTFSQDDSKSASAVLNMDSKTQALVQSGPEENGYYIYSQIDNLGFKDFPVNVSLFFPTKLEHNFEMTNYQVFVHQNKTQCTGITTMTSDYCLPEKNCKLIVCDSFILKRDSPIEITLSGDVHFKDLKQHAMNIGFLKKYTGDTAEVKFKSFIYVNYDKQRYVLNSYKQERSGNIPTETMTEVRVEFVIPPDEVVIIATGAAMGLLLLLIITVIMFKLGCFKRKRLEYCEVQEEETAPQDGIPAKSTTGTTQGICSHSETDSKSDQLSAHQSLLDDGEANCSTSSVHS